MGKFYFIQYPEQIFNFKDNDQNSIPVIPVFKELDDFNRIVSFFKRKGNAFGIFYDRTIYPLKQFLLKSSEFEIIFTSDADIAKILREMDYSGKIYLLSNFRMLVHSGFYEEFKIIPVVSGKSNYNLSIKNGLKPVYFLSDKICVAEFGLCISRKSTPQYFFNCDNRCREKSNAKKGIEFPLSIKPENCCPKEIDSVVFSEKPFFFSINDCEMRDQILEKSWNYRYPLGIEILKPGKSGNGRNYTFSLDKKTEHLFQKGLIDFFGYSGSVYKGRWIKSAKAKQSSEDKISISIAETYQSVLMIQRYTEDERDFLKKARHFIYTLPEKKILEDPLEIDEEIIEPVKDFPVRKYSGKIKLTLVSDDIKKFNAFKSRDVERKVLIYNRDVHKGFSDYLFIAGSISDNDFKEISMMRKLKGVVVPDGIMKEAFERILPDKEILLHPLAYYDSRKSPSYISASTTIFVSKFKSEKRNSYSWNDINIFLKSQIGFSEFVSRKKLTRTGGRKELWVNIADITDDALKYLKSQAESIVRNIKRN